MHPLLKKQIVDAPSPAYIEGASIIEEANCGFIAPPNNALKLNEQIKNFLNTSKRERINLGENGTTFYQKNFSSKIRKKEFIAYFEN